MGVSSVAVTRVTLKMVGWLVWFYGISTTMGYLMPNLVHIY